MKKAQQAAQKKEPKEKKTLMFFASWEQIIGLVFFIGVLMLSSWIIYSVKDWVDNPERVVLSQLTITGDKSYTYEDDVRNAIMGLGFPNTYIGQDVDDIQQEVLRLPWIKQVSVRKQWPDRLIVHLVEYQPRYVWNEVFLLDNDGAMFSVPMDRMQYDGLPKLFGPVGKEHLILDTYQKLYSISQTTNKQQYKINVATAYADERNAWQLIISACMDGSYSQNIKLVLGKDKILERYERFIKLYPQIQRSLAGNEQIMEVDLRYENGISITKQYIAR